MLRNHYLADAAVWICCLHANQESTKKMALLIACHTFLLSVSQPTSVTLPINILNIRTFAEEISSLFCGLVNVWTGLSLMKLNVFIICGLAEIVQRHLPKLLHMDIRIQLVLSPLVPGIMARSNSLKPPMLSQEHWILGSDTSHEGKNPTYRIFMIVFSDYFE